jgi:hypothetical protein
MSVELVAIRGPLHDAGCLFCRRDDGGFAGEEHIIGYALGNRDFVLPPGVVCDRCNNGPLQKAEQALSSFPIIEMLRAERGLGTRSNRGLLISMDGTRVWWEAPGELCVSPAKPGVVTRTGPSRGKLELTTGKPEPARRFERMTHAVWKAALEDVYRIHGPELAFDPKFDRIRNATIGHTQSRGWAFCPKESKPHNEVTLSILPCVTDGRERCPVCLDVFGVAIVTDLLDLDLERDQIQPPIPSNVWVFGDE